MDTKPDDSNKDSMIEEEREKPKDPADTNKRFIFLALACLLCIGSYYVYDNPAALEVRIEDV